MTLSIWLNSLRRPPARRTSKRRRRSIECVLYTEILQSRILLSGVTEADATGEDEAVVSSSGTGDATNEDTTPNENEEPDQELPDIEELSDNDAINATDDGLDFIRDQVDQLLEEELPAPEVDLEQIEAALEVLENTPLSGAPSPTVTEQQQAIAQVRRDALTGDSGPTMTMQSTGFLALVPVGDGSGRVFGIVNGDARVWQASDKLTNEQTEQWKADHGIDAAVDVDVYAGYGEEVTDRALRGAINHVVGYPTQLTNLKSIIDRIPGGDRISDDLQIMEGVALVLTGNAELMAEVEAMRMDGAGNLEAGLHLGIEGGTNAVIGVTIGLGLVGMVKIYKMIKAIPNAEDVVTDSLQTMSRESIEILERRLAALDEAGDLSDTTIRNALDDLVSPEAIRSILQGLDDIPWGQYKQFGCEAIATRIQGAVGGTVHRFTNVVPNTFLGPRGGIDTHWYHHEVVIKDGRVYDALTGVNGLPIAEFKNLWSYKDVINFGF